MFIGSRKSELRRFIFGRSIAGKFACVRLRQQPVQYVAEHGVLVQGLGASPSAAHPGNLRVM